MLTWASPDANDNAALAAIGLYSALTVGNLLIDGALTSGLVTLQDGSSITAIADAITIDITGGGLTDEGSKRCLKGGFIPSTDSLYISLHSAQPLDGDTVEHELPTTTGAYGRVTVANSGWTVNGATVTNPGRLSNISAISWTTPTATWLQPTHVGVYDAATGGNLLYYDAVDSAVSAPVSGATVQMAATSFFIDLAQDS